MVLLGFGGNGDGEERGEGKVRLTARHDEDRVAQSNDREMPEVLVVNRVATDAQKGKPYGEAVDEAEEHLEGDDGVDETGQEFLRGDGVLFNELGEVVETRCYCSAMIN